MEGLPHEGTDTCPAICWKYTSYFLAQKSRRNAFRLSECLSLRVQ